MYHTLPQNRILYTLYQYVITVSVSKLFGLSPKPLKLQWYFGRKMHISFSTLVVELWLLRCAWWPARTWSECAPSLPLVTCFCTLHIRHFSLPKILQLQEKRQISALFIPVVFTLYSSRTVRSCCGHGLDLAILNCVFLFRLLVSIWDIHSLSIKGIFRVSCMPQVLVKNESKCVILLGTFHVSKLGSILYLNQKRFVVPLPLWLGTKKNVKKKIFK